jgi:2,4-dienoyl-CoA reductase-like NADH-dependent reductase (Old Yellow Enzyme family)
MSKLTMMPKLNLVFSPLRVKNVELPNRIVFPPIATNFADEEGYITDKLINYLRDIAKGGAGLIIVENTAVNLEGRNLSNEPRLDDDRYIKDFRRLVDEVHKAGTKISIQLHHGGRSSSSKVHGFTPVAPSAIPCPLFKEMPRSMTIQDIHRTILDFAQAARRAKEAGADAVEIHGASGFLPAQFLSPYANKRTDEYGGSKKNRLRFPLELIKEMRKKVGPDYVIGYRFSGDEYVVGGLTLDDHKEIAPELVRAGADILHVTAGVLENVEEVGIVPFDKKEEGWHNYLAAGIKEVVDVPVITVGKITSLVTAQKVLQENTADLVSIGRALIADPGLVIKSREGRFDDIVQCKQCNGCIHTLYYDGVMRCEVNPKI